MMHHYQHSVYVFDSSTANEAASAIEKGQFENIIQYHSNKHQKQHPPPPNAGQQQQIHSQNIIQQPGQTMMTGGPNTGYPPTHQVPSPNTIQRISGPPPASNIPHPQLYEANLSPQKIKEREGHLNKLGQLAQLTTPAPNMSMAIQNRPMQAPHQPVPNQQHTSQQQQPQSQGTLPSQQPPPQQPRQLSIKSESMQQGALDPISSMQAMSENVQESSNIEFTMNHNIQN